jgi:hypothetical protein
MSKRLLVIHHTPSPYTQEMFEAVVAGATDPEIEGVDIVLRPALTVAPVDMLEADGYLLRTPPRLGVDGQRLAVGPRRAVRGTEDWRGWTDGACPMNIDATVVARSNGRRRNGPGGVIGA